MIYLIGLELVGLEDLVIALELLVLEDLVIAVDDELHVQGRIDLGQLLLDAHEERGIIVGPPASLASAMSMLAGLLPAPA